MKNKISCFLVILLQCVSCTDETTGNTTSDQLQSEQVSPPGARDFNPAKIDVHSNSSTEEATFNELFETVQSGYCDIDNSKRIARGQLKETVFDFIRWAPNEEFGVRCMTVPENPSYEYFLCPNFHETGKDLEIFVQSYGAMKLLWLNWLDNTTINPDSGYAMNATLTNMKLFPSIPGCFIRFQERMRLVYIAGMDWDRTIFEPPFSRTGQLENIFFCDGNLQAIGRLYCYKGIAYAIGRYKSKDGRLQEDIYELRAGQEKLYLDSWTLDSLFSTFDSASFRTYTVEVMVSDIEIPIWLQNYGLYRTRPPLSQIGNIEGYF